MLTDKILNYNEIVSTKMYDNNNDFPDQNSVIKLLACRRPLYAFELSLAFITEKVILWSSNSKQDMDELDLYHTTAEWIEEARYVWRFTSKEAKLFTVYTFQFFWYLMYS